jgi:hypothetical protein
MSPATLDEIPAQSVRGPSEVFIRRGLIALTVIAGLGVVCHFAMLLWAQNEFTQPESIVATQSTMLARDGTLYYDLKHYPYTVCAYMPLFYLLQAAFIKLGVPALIAGRLISFAALAGIFCLAWRLLMVYTKDPYYAWLGTILCASTSLLLSWGTVGQVDTLALFFSIAGFYYYSRHALQGDKTLILAAACVLLSLFTKQTYLACPVAIFVSLLFERPKTALRFAAGVGGVGLGLVFLINAAMHGRFLTNVIFADIFPFALEKIDQHIHYLLIGAGQLILIVLIGLRGNLRGARKAPLIYLAFSLSILALTAPKVGSDSNYQIELTFLLIVCSCLALHALDFFPLLFRGSKVWITLLQAPLAIHLLLNYRITLPFLAARFAKEKMFREQIVNLRPYFAGDGRVLSAETNALLHFRGRIEVEPLICKMLARTGVIDPEPLRRDLAQERFETVFLYQDLTRPEEIDLEVPSLPESQMNEIRRHYRLIKHIPGPYLAGVYVYKPVTPQVRP